MGRSPCCDKVGLKRGPWTPQEDQLLVSFIQQHGHSNWRALPKQSGLLRCGKSCRLRWINYLKPDVKRGNFTKEEEDTIIQLHERMGNRWSAIAARLPGRTDNEIKNVWHTHLKKRLINKNHQTITQAKVTTNKHSDNNAKNVANSHTTSNSSVTSDEMPNSSQQSYFSDDFSTITEVSSVQTMPNNMANVTDVQEYEIDELPIIDDTFWSPQEILYDDISMDFAFLNTSTIQDEKILGEFNDFSSMYMGNGLILEAESVDFWLDIFVSAGGAPDLPEF